MHDARQRLQRLLARWARRLSWYPGLYDTPERRQEEAARAACAMRVLACERDEAIEPLLDRLEAVVPLLSPPGRRLLIERLREISREASR